MAIWTDNPATSSTHIRARHINELRRTVDRNRRVANLSAMAWTDNPVSSAVHIRAIHFNEIRAAIPASVPIGNWSVGHPPASTRQISARDINDLRGWVDQFSQSLGFPPGPDPVPQGVTSFTVDPNSAPPGSLPSAYIMVDQTWVNDILALRTSQTGPLLLRAEVKTAMSTDPTVNNYLPVDAYGTALQLYGRNGLLPHALLASEFDRQNTGSPSIGPYNAALTTTWTNPYIVDFARRAGLFANVLASAYGVTHYIVWNEPDDAGGAYLGADRFAGLMHETFSAITSNAPGAKVYMGGLLWPNGATKPGGGAYSPTEATDYLIGYLGAVYDYLGRHSGGIPWHAMNVQIHDAAFEDGDMFTLILQLLHQRSSNADTGPIYVGEWGTNHHDSQTAGQMQKAFTLLNKYFDGMFYFQHPSNGDPTMGRNLCCDPSICGGDYGLITWDENSATLLFENKGRCSDWTVLQNLFQTNPNP